MEVAGGVGSHIELEGKVDASGEFGGAFGVFEALNEVKSVSFPCSEGRLGKNSLSAAYTALAAAFSLSSAISIFGLWCRTPPKYTYTHPRPSALRLHTVPGTERDPAPLRLQARLAFDA